MCSFFNFQDKIFDESAFTYVFCLYEANFNKVTCIL